jgi:hypothetical protein
MKSITITFVLIFTVSTFLQGQSKVDFESDIKSLNEKVKSLQGENTKLKNQVENLDNNLSRNTMRLDSRLDSLNILTQTNANAISSTNQELGLKITETGKTSEKKITAVNDSLSKSTLYWIIAFLATALLLGLVYFLLGKRIRTGKTDVEDQILKTKKSLEEEGIKLDTKLSEILESQLKIVQAERTSSSAAANPEEIDHSLALKVADEIMRINKNLSNMDANTKGLKQLAASVKRIEDNFAANGYDMPELLNKPFDTRMKVIVANSIPDENLKSGEEIITRIIKPQVNFKGIMIQAAQVEVSVGQ